MMNDKIKNALSAEETQAPGPSSPAEAEAHEPRIVTTQEELEAYFIVKNLLKDIAPADDIVYKDTETYLSILYTNNVRKWICRVIFNSTSKFLIIPDENKKEQRFTLESIYDIEKFKDQLTEVLKRYL